jgi:hypothetical protein
MLSRAFLLSAGLVVGTTAFAQSTIALPANIQSARAAVAQAVTVLTQAVAKRKADAASSNAAALPADDTAIRIDRMLVGEAMQALRSDADAFLAPDRANLLAALNQLQTDQLAANAAAVATDTAAVASSEQTLRQDRQAIFAGLGLKGMRGGGKHSPF